MRASRVVTGCLLYSGAVLVAQYALVYRFEVGIVPVAQLLTGLSIFASGAYRLRGDHSEPEQYGPLTYGLAALTISLTAIFVGQLSLVYWSSLAGV